MSVLKNDQTKQNGITNIWNPFFAIDIFCALWRGFDLFFTQENQG